MKGYPGPATGTIESDFQDVGDQCTQQFAAVIAGSSSVDMAIRNCQATASGVR